MRGARIIAATIVAVIGWAAPAWAGVRTGSQANWPPAAFDINRQAYNASPAKLTVTYDDTAGQVTTSVDLARPLSQTASRYISFNYGLAVPQSGHDCSDSAQLTQLAYVSGWYDAYDGSAYGSMWFDPASGYTGGTNLRDNGSFSISANRYDFTIGGGQAATRQAYSCIANVSFSSSQYFQAPNFCLGTCPQGGAPGGGGPSGPLAPTGVHARADGNQIVLTWDKSADPNFSYFAVRRATDPNSDLATWTRLGPSFTRPTASDTPPRPGVYYYYVTEIDSARHVSARSAVVRVEIESQSSVPTGVQARVANGRVVLSWDRSPDPDFAYFAVRRGSDPNSDTASWTRLAPNFTSPTATDDPGPGTFYYYVTEISQSKDVSDRSSVVRVTVPASTDGGGGSGDNGGTGSTGGSSGGGGTGGGSSGGVLGAGASHRARMTSRQVKAAVLKTLSRHLGRTFRQRSGLRMSCRAIKRGKVSCSFSWRHGHQHFKGRAIVVRRASGRIALTAWNSRQTR